MGLRLDNSDGQTPLDEEEISGLRIPGIATRGELDEFEQQNIEQAIQWTLGRSFKAETVFTEDFLNAVPRRMYADVWTWAGKFRETEKNFGVLPWQIALELKKLLDDALFWHENKIYAPDEIALRFKHRLVSIHCFSNGNGRHSRLMADIIIEKLFKRPVFSWGSANLSKTGDPRAAYLKAIKTADQGDYGLLLEFARS